jgi:hypothetical protein
MVNPVITPMVIAARMKKYFRRFENAGAISPETSRTLKSLGLQGGILFNKLLRNGVFIEQTPGMYYVSRLNYEKYKSARRFRVVAILGGIIIIIVVISIFL